MAAAGNIKSNCWIIKKRDLIKLITVIKAFCYHLVLSKHFGYCMSIVSIAAPQAPFVHLIQIV